MSRRLRTRNAQSLALGQQAWDNAVPPWFNEPPEDEEPIEACFDEPEPDGLDDWDGPL